MSDTKSDSTRRAMFAPLPRHPSILTMPSPKRPPWTVISCNGRPWRIEFYSTGEAPACEMPDEFLSREEDGRGVFRLVPLEPDEPKLGLHRGGAL